MDDFNAAGLIPASLLRWELTGRKSQELEGMLHEMGRPRRGEPAPKKEEAGPGPASKKAVEKVLG
jgi:hypothetical protein